MARGMARSLGAGSSPRRARTAALAIAICAFASPGIADEERPEVGLAFSTFFGGRNPGGDGVRELAFDPQGYLIVAGHPGPLADELPNTVRFGRIDGDDAYVAKLTPDASKLVWLAVIGGSGVDRGYGIDVDREGNVFLAGRTSSLDFPTTEGAFDRTNNGGGCAGPHGCRLDGYVLKLSADGRRLLYSTYLGGEGIDGFRGGVAVDDQGFAYCVGELGATRSYPGALNGYLGGESDGIVAKLSPDGSRVVWSRFVGSSDDRGLGEGLFGVEVDGEGNVLLHGSVGGSDAPTTPDAFDRTPNGGHDVYFVKLAPDGQRLLHATLVGGRREEYAEHRMARDSAGNSYLVGQTRSADFPIVNGHRSPVRGEGDGYLIKLDASGRVVFTSRFGGSRDETALGPGVDAGGRIFVTGQTSSPDFDVTPGALGPKLRGEQDAFLRVYAPTGALLYSSYFGGSANDFARYATADPSGAAVIAGTTFSADLPTTPGVFERSYSGVGTDSFIARFVMRLPGTTPTRERGASPAGEAP